MVLALVGGMLQLKVRAMPSDTLRLTVESARETMVFYLTRPRISHCDAIGY
jgi:hypothetical protein